MSTIMVAFELPDGLKVIVGPAGGEADREHTDIGDGNDDDIIEQELEP